VGAFPSLVVLIAMIMYYQSHVVDNDFSQFLDSESFGVGLLMTIARILIKLFFAYADRGKFKFVPSTVSSP